MEYRRKHTKSYRQRQGQAGGGRACSGYLRAGQSGSAYWLIGIVFFGIVYLIGASKAGTWVAVNWIAPALRQSSAALPSTAEPAFVQTPAALIDSDATREMTLPEKTFYALQIGVYADEENAKAQSSALKKIGAAGYILKDGERFRVLASAYQDKESAAKVADQLTREGIESRIYTIVRTRRTFKITGNAGQIEAVYRAVERTDALLESFYNAFLAFDRDKQSVTDAITALHAIKTETETLHEAVVQVNAADGSLGGMDTFYDAVVMRLGQLTDMAAVGTVEFSAALKELYLAALLSLK